MTMGRHPLDMARRIGSSHLTVLALPAMANPATLANSPASNAWSTPPPGRPAETS